MGYIIKYGNKYASCSSESERADYTIEDMKDMIFKYLESIQSQFEDSYKNLPQDWASSVFFNCIEESNGLGAKLKPCPFCKRNMMFMRGMHRNKMGHYYVSQCYMHADDKSEECILDDLMMPLCLGAGDARPEDDFLGEYAEKWNNSLSENTSE